MPTGLFPKILVILFLISLGFAKEIQANNSPRLINEKFVINALQIIHSAQVTFNATVGNGNYGTFEQLKNENFIDGVLATGEKYSYRFTVIITNGAPNQAASFQVSAVPQRYGKSGKRSFFIDESGTVRGADRNGSPANGSDPPVPVNCGESGAILSMRALHSAEITYGATAGNGNYGTLKQLAQAGLINSYLATGTHCGYLFRIYTTASSTNTPATFAVKAVPVQYGATGFRSFYIDEQGILRGADRGGAEATANDPPIEY